MKFDFDHLTKTQRDILTVLSNEEVTTASQIMWCKFYYSNVHERFLSCVEAAQKIKPNEFRRKKHAGNTALMSALCDWRKIMPEVNDKLDGLLDSAVDVKFMNKLPNDIVDAYSFINDNLNRFACRYLKMRWNEAVYERRLSERMTFDVFFKKYSVKIKIRNGGKWTLKSILTHQLQVADNRLKHEWQQYGEYKSAATDKDLLKYDTIEHHVQWALRTINRYEGLMKYIVVKYVSLFLHTCFISVFLSSYMFHICIFGFIYVSYLYFWFHIDFVDMLLHNQIIIKRQIKPQIQHVFHKQMVLLLFHN